MRTTRSIALWIMIGMVPGVAVAETVDIARPDGSLQCEPGSGVALSESAAALAGNGIDADPGREAHDGMMRPAVCGAPTGMLHVFTIDVTHLPKAETLGFRRFSP